MTEVFFGNSLFDTADGYGECRASWRVNKPGCQIEKLQNFVASQPVSPEIRGVYNNNGQKVYYSKDYFNNSISKYKTYVKDGKVKSVDFSQIPRRVSENGKLIPAENLAGRSFTIVEGLPVDGTTKTLSKAKLCLRGVLNKMGIPEVDLNKSFVKSTENISNIAKKYLKYMV